MYGRVPDIYPHDELQRANAVRETRQSLCIQVRSKLTLWKMANGTLRHITNVPTTRGWERKIAEGPPCVVLASPGFMDSGPSRELLELWAPDSRNGLIVTGYSIEGTMARVSDYHRIRRRLPSCTTTRLLYVPCKAMDVCYLSSFNGVVRLPVSVSRYS